MRPPPRSTLFPYTTLFRSRVEVFAEVEVSDRALALRELPEPAVERIGWRRRRRRREGREKERKRSPAAFAAEARDAEAQSDAVEVGPRRAAGVEARSLAVETHERFLCDVFGLEVAPQDASRKGSEGPEGFLDERTKRIGVREGAHLSLLRRER